MLKVRDLERIQKILTIHLINLKQEQLAENTKDIRRLELQQQIIEVRDYIHKISEILGV